MVAIVPGSPTPMPTPRAILSDRLNPVSVLAAAAVVAPVPAVPLAEGGSTVPESVVFLVLVVVLVVVGVGVVVGRVDVMVSVGL